MTQPTDRGERRVALVVEDEEPLAKLVGAYLERDGFDVTVANDGRTGLEQARRIGPDLVVLDLGLPLLDGVDLCRSLREFSDCYVLMLTARAEETDKLLGLETGADDYMTKPFSPRELAARARVLMRRPRTPAAGTTSIADLVVDSDRHEVRRSGEQVSLTPTEFDVLLTFMARPDTVLTRRQILDAVWGENWVGDDNLVEVHVARLRRKLGTAEDGRHYVETVRGVGYRLRDPE